VREDQPAVKISLAGFLIPHSEINRRGYQSSVAVTAGYPGIGKGSVSFNDLAGPNTSRPTDPLTHNPEASGPRGTSVSSILPISELFAARPSNHQKPAIPLMRVVVLLEDNLGSDRNLSFLDLESGTMVLLVSPLRDTVKRFFTGVGSPSR
jgi:hypothetical protein